MAYVRVDDPEFWQAVLPVQALVGSVGSWASAVTSFVANTLLVLLLMVALIIGRRRFDERLDLAAGHATGRMKASARVIGKFEKVRDSRDKDAVAASLSALEAAAAKDDENLMPYLIDCCHAYATVGEMVATLKSQWGEFEEPVRL